MASRRCKSCNAKIIAYPVYKGQEFNIPLLKGETPGEKFRSLFTRETMSKINWYNLLIGDWIKLFILGSLIFVAWAYGHDTQVCRDIYGNPCQFIEQNRLVCTDIIEEYT